MITHLSKGPVYYQVSLRPEEGYGFRAETREDGMVDVEEVEIGKVFSAMAERIRNGESSIVGDHIHPHPTASDTYLIVASKQLQPTVRYRNPSGRGEVITMPTSMVEFKLGEQAE